MDEEVAPADVCVSHTSCVFAWHPSCSASDLLLLTLLEFLRRDVPVSSTLALHLYVLERLLLTNFIMLPQLVRLVNSRKLHWLPVESRIIFKVLLITFKIIHGLCPAYLSSLLQLYQPQRSLRSSSKLLFTVPTVNFVTYGERAFSFSAPILWNNLPDPIKNTTSLSSFKSALKTFLFRKFYF